MFCVRAGEAAERKSGARRSIEVVDVDTSKQNETRWHESTENKSPDEAKHDDDRAPNSRDDVTITSGGIGVRQSDAPGSQQYPFSSSRNERPRTPEPHENSVERKYP